MADSDPQHVRVEDVDGNPIEVVGVSTDGEMLVITINPPRAE